MRRKVIICIITFILLIAGVLKVFSAKVGNTGNEMLRDSIYSVMDEYGIHHKEIVYAQAILETGHFKANIFTKKNNLFGLQSKKGYYSFKHWSESVKMYKEKIQSRYKNDEDYYHFLKRIHYATNLNYTKLLKKLVRK